MWNLAESLFVLAQALDEHNPASHLIWWVAGVAWLVVAVMVLSEIFGQVRRRLWRRRDGRGGGWKLEVPDSNLRRRFYRRLPPLVRLWGQKMGTNERWHSPSDPRGDRT